MFSVSEQACQRGLLTPLLSIHQPSQAAALHTDNCCIFITNVNTLIYYEPYACDHMSTQNIHLNRFMHTLTCAHTKQGCLFYIFCFIVCVLCSSSPLDCCCAPLPLSAIIKPIKSSEDSAMLLCRNFMLLALQFIKR